MRTPCKIAPASPVNRCRVEPVSQKLTNSKCRKKLTAHCHSWLFPIKSCGGFRVSSASITPMGLQHDRQWAIIKLADGVVHTVCAFPQLATIATSLTSTHLVLQTSSSDTFAVPLVDVADGSLLAMTARKPGIVTCDVPVALYPDSERWIGRWLGKEGYCLVRLCAEGALRIGCWWQWQWLWQLKGQ